MKLSELIAAVGDDNIMFQTLATDMKNAGVYSSGGQITFATSTEMVIDMMKDEPEFIGLVVWLPKAFVPETVVSEEET